MALTELQRAICRLIADNRIASGESYVAGGVALGELTGSSRISRDIDNLRGGTHASFRLAFATPPETPLARRRAARSAELYFHDTDEALDASWRADRRLLEDHGFSVSLLRERPSFVEAEVGRQGDHVRMEWARDSAFRFFPLVRHPELGLTLHPFDLATNKVLALVGRLEVRDWVDLITSGQSIQPLGYLAWAACGKDPGFSPRSILEQAARTCVLTVEGDLCRAAAAELPPLVDQGKVAFHAGSIRGALPVIRG